MCGARFSFAALPANTGSAARCVFCLRPRLIKPFAHKKHPHKHWRQSPARSPLRVCHALVHATTATSHSPLFFLRASSLLSCKSVLSRALRSIPGVSILRSLCIPRTQLDKGALVRIWYECTADTSAKALDSAFLGDSKALSNKSALDRVSWTTAVSDRSKRSRPQKVRQKESRAMSATARIVL